MTHGATLADELQREAARLRQIRLSAAPLAGIRATQARGEIDGAIAALERARAFLLAAQSGVMPAAAPDPRRDPEP